MAAPALRIAAPTASIVKVTLQFVPPALPMYADQSFSLYPSARAYFGYPCPYGDCNGIFDLGAAARRTLNREEDQVVGSLVCEGLRSRDGASRQACGMRVTYTITAQHEPAAEARWKI